MLIVLGNSLAPTLRNYFRDCADRTDQRIQLLPASIGKFVSSEAFSEIKALPADIQGQSVTVIQSLAAVDDHSANDFVMQLFLTVRTLKRNGSGPVWVVMPFAAYGRQDKTSPTRMTSVAIDDLGFLLKQAGAVGVSTIEMHSDAGIQFLKSHFSKSRVYDLDPTDLYADDIRQLHSRSEDILVGGPDAGANHRADAIAQALRAQKFSFTKQHVGVNETAVTSFEGDVTGKTTVTIDDMIDTGGTIENSQVILERHGAQRRYVYGAHGVFSQGGLHRLFTAKAAADGGPLITQLIVTDSIDISAKLSELRRQYGDENVTGRIRQIAAGPMLLEHIKSDISCHPAMNPGAP